MTTKAPRKQSKYVTQAIEILRKKIPTPNNMEILGLVKQLKRGKAFGYAQRLLEQTRESLDPETDALQKLKLAQEHALCTYKDPDLPVSDRLDRALRILEAADGLQETQNQETLGLAGAIFKRKWEVGGQKIHLEQSLYHYLRGYQQGPANDQGYTGINAAFVLDQLAGLEAKQAHSAGMSSQTAEERWKQARQIRKELLYF